MTILPLIALIGLNLLSANPISLDVLNQISEITHKVLTYANPVTGIHGSDIICNFERENCIGVAWLDRLGNEWSYNYVRLNEEGHIILDLRKFTTKNDHLDEFGIDWEDGVPQFEYLVDNDGNSLLIYSYFTKLGWRIGWVKIDSAGHIVEDQYFTRNTHRLFNVCISEKYGFHLFPGYGYTNRELNEIVSLTDQYQKQEIIPYPPYPDGCIEIAGGNILLIGHNPYSKQIQCQIISDKGELLVLDTLNIDDITFASWDGIDIPDFCEIYRSDKTIYYILSANKSMKHIAFSNDGSVIVPERRISGNVLDVQKIPSDVKKMIKMKNGIIYYFGLDTKGNLYYWKNRQKDK
jgi:phage pi2 protein 07